MFRRAVITLTAWYLLLIMLLSLVFSLLLYHALSREVESSLRRQAPKFTADIPNGPLPRERFEDFRRSEISEAQGRAIGQLVLFNLAVLVIGASVSYLLARRTLRPIEETLEAQRRFTSDASHELRTPLAVMRAELEVALRGNRHGGRGDNVLVRSTLEEVKQLEKLTNRLLELARADEAPFKQGACDVTEAVDAALKRNKAIAKKKKVSLEQKIVNCKAAIDPEVLTDIISILLENGIKYNHAGGNVKIKGQQKAAHIELQIIDTGSGIAKEELEKIFERFYQADSARSRKEGESFGLGLPLARRLLERFGGSISVSSEIGAGTTFTVRLKPAKDNAHLQN